MGSEKQKSIQYIEHVNDTTKPYVILFHGFGADMNDLESLKDMMNPDQVELNWIFPNGTFTVPIGPGFTGRAWWPLQMAQLPSDWTNYSPPEMTDLVPRVLKLIESLNVPWNQIVLGGFSQGAMLATEIYFQAPQKPLGLLSLSGSLIRKETWVQKCAERKNEKIFLSHGEQDQVLPSGGTQKLIQVLKQNDLLVDFVSFQGGHEIPLQVCTRAKKYLTEKTEPFK